MNNVKPSEIRSRKHNEDYKIDIRDGAHVSMKAKLCQSPAKDVSSMPSVVKAGKSNINHHLYTNSSLTKVRGDDSEANYHAGVSDMGDRL